MPSFVQQRRVIQLAPAALQGWPGSGYWKDFQGRRILLEQLGVSTQFGWYDVQDLTGALAQVDDLTTDVIIEYSTCPALISAIRQVHKQVRVHVRAHNAEALQHWHRVQPSLWPTVDNLRKWYGTARMAVQDRRCAALADTLLSISAWDLRHYWERLLPGGRCKCLPYFSPWPSLRPETRPLPWKAREHQVVCMPGGLDRLTRQQTELFGYLAKALRDSEPGNAPRCAMTNYSGDALADASFVSSLGKIDDPWGLLCRSKGVAVLTDLGFGAKTTLFDGLAAGCRLFVHKGLIPRLPAAIQPHCSAIDPADWNASATLVRSQLESPPAGKDIAHSQLQAEAVDVMSSVLNLTDDMHIQSRTGDGLAAHRILHAVEEELA
ncbi:MAG: hypothetical protein ACK5Q5_12350 [Planctomycetaceae bacterium]